ncbi:MAG TPA: GNAT family N-acyltransferase [Blastocatellia bacterium]|nr:GNAT family N-acyltransferase [Blastocatellia bacterium]
MNLIERPNSTSESLAFIEPAAYPVFTRAIPQKEIREGRYNVRFARTREELDAVLKLRFEVFNLELGEGLESSLLTFRDLDEFDDVCHHLIVEDTDSGRIVGTYRMQTGEMAAAARGFYSAMEFDLSHFPVGVLKDSVELGRACVAGDHRNTQVLFLLWKGLAAYVAHNQKRYLFGCCSLTSQDEGEGLRVMELLKQGGHFHPSFSIRPRSGFECRFCNPAREPDRQASIPKLFRIYMHYGAKVCGPPAIDRQFKTIDFLVLFDVFEMDAQTRRMFFGA